MTTKSIILRRLTSFSLRTALITFTVISVAIGLHLPSVKQQRLAVEAFKSQGGYVVYDREVIGSPTSWMVIQRLPVPQWIVSTLGDDHFHSVVQISTFKPIGTDQGFLLHSNEMLQHLDGLPHLQVIELHLTPVDNESLKSIGQLKQLRKLQLGRAMGVTDEGVCHLAQLKRLEHLEMNYSSLTDTSIETLGTLANLQVLNIEGEFSEGALSHLRHLENLRELALVGMKSTELSDESIISVKNLRGLQRLSLWHLRVTEDGMRHPKPLRLP